MVSGKRTVVARRRKAPAVQDAAFVAMIAESPTVAAFWCD